MSQPTSGDRPGTPTIVSPAYRSLRPLVRTTFQLAAESPVGTPEAGSALQRAATTIVRWIEGRYGQALPPPAYRGESFECDQWGHKQVECIAVPELGTWTARLTHADEPFRGRPAVAGRTWTTDVSLQRRQQSIGIAVRCFCASRPDCQDDVALTRPAVVLDLARVVGLAEIRPLDGQPWLLQSASDLTSLRDLLIDPRRTLPVIMLTQPDRSRYGIQITDYVLEAPVLSRRLQAVAHVVLMPWTLGYQWTDLVGQPWSAYLGAVRTYRPGLDFDEDPPSSHPRTFIDRILFWRHEDLQGEAAFLEFLVNQMYFEASTKRIDWGDCLFITDARTKAAEIARERLHREVIGQQSTVGEVAALRTRIEQLETAHSKEREALNAKIAEAQKDAEEWSADSLQAAKDREYYGDENKKLRAQIDMLRARLTEKIGQAVDATVPIPQSIEELPDWVATHLAGRLELHPRALRGVKNARYEDVGLVYRALLLLANEYRNMRLGFDEAKDAYDNGIKRLGLRHDGSITQERAGHEGDEYYVRYPVGAQTKRFLELHLRKGSSKDERYCLAVYFFWDDDTQQVVVGWLPSHLDNRQT